MTNETVCRFFVRADSPIREAVEVIDRAKQGVALVVDGDGVLQGTITDGDVRRWMLSVGDLDGACESLMVRQPVTALEGSTDDEIERLLDRHRIRNIPVVDERGVVVGVSHLSDFARHGSHKRIAVLMAGGEGRRLRPLTDSIPKPMVKVGDKPILEVIVEHLVQSDVEKIYLAVNYRASVIERHFQDGSDFGVEIAYLREQSKLGTAGALSLLSEKPTDAFLVMNGDLLSNVNFDHIIDFHHKHRAGLTIAATEFHLQVPYGVLNLAGHFVQGVTEKPTQNLYCNAGIYVVDPEVLHLIPQDQAFNMTQLAEAVIQIGLPVAAFPMREYWIDIGQKGDLDRAQEAMADIKRSGQPSTRTRRQPARMEQQPRKPR